MCPYYLDGDRTLRFRTPSGALGGCGSVIPVAVVTISAATTGITEPHRECGGFDHRQDSKGTWWMPWHLESMKGVNGCDKPR